MFEVGLWIIEPFVDRNGKRTRRCHPPNSLSPEAVRQMAARAKPPSVAPIQIRPRPRIGIVYQTGEMDGRKHLEALADLYGTVK